MAMSISARSCRSRPERRGVVEAPARAAAFVEAATSVHQGAHEARARHAPRPEDFVIAPGRVHPHSRGPRRHASPPPPARRADPAGGRRETGSRSPVLIGRRPWQCAPQWRRVDAIRSRERAAPDRGHREPSRRSMTAVGLSRHCAHLLRAEAAISPERRTLAETGPISPCTQGVRSAHASHCAPAPPGPR